MIKWLKNKVCPELRQLKKTLRHRENTIEQLRETRGALRLTLSQRENTINQLRNTPVKKRKLDQQKLAAWSKRVRDRDGGCRICGTPDQLTAHHLYSKNHYSQLMYVDENGIALCKDHHDEFHAAYPQECKPSDFERWLLKRSM